MRMIRYCLLALAALAAAGSTNADAGTLTRWSTAAQGCVVEPGSAALLAQDATGAVRFSGSATGTAFVICPVAVFSFTSQCGMGLGLTSTDPDANLNNYVRAWLNALPIGTGSVASIAATVSTAHAKAFDMLGFQHVFDFDANYYYVVIEMHRSSPTANVAFYGTLLQDPVTCIF